MSITQYEQTHLAGVLALCEAEEWTSFPADPTRAHTVLTAPGATAVVALDGDLVTGSLISKATALSRRTCR